MSLIRINKQKSRRRLHNERRGKYRKQFARTFENRVRRLVRHCSNHPNDHVAVAAFSRARSRRPLGALLRFRPTSAASMPRSANNQLRVAHQPAA